MVRPLGGRGHRPGGARGIESIVAQLESEDAERLRRGLQSFVQAALADEKAVNRVCLHCGIEHVGECLVNQAREQVAPTVQAEV